MSWLDELFGKQKDFIPNGHVTVDADWYHMALKHYCEPCNRWFSDARGKSSHDRYKHKE